jgi:hypothetical protein
MLNAVGWRVVSDVSGRNNLTLEDWTDILSPNVGNKLQTYTVQVPKKSKNIIIVVFLVIGYLG